MFYLSRVLIFVFLVGFALPEAQSRGRIGVRPIISPTGPLLPRHPRLYRFRFESYEKISLYIQKTLGRNITKKQFDKWIEKEHAAGRHLWIPRSIASHFRGKGWRGWPAFMGRGLMEPKPYAEAARHMRENYPHIRTMDEYYKWIRIEHSQGRNLDMPKYPIPAYGSNWLGIADFLGGIKIKSYKQASLHMRENYPHIRKFKDYQKWIKEEQEAGRNLDMPRNLRGAYTGIGWQGWHAFIGKEFSRRTLFNRQYAPRVAVPRGEYKKRPKSILPLEETIKIVRDLGIKSEEEFDIWHLDTDAQVRWGIPENPARYYRKKGWVDWPTFLGQKFRSYDEVSSYVRENAFYIQTASQYKAWVGQEHKKGRLPWAPRSPDLIYAEVWKGWDHFLGNSKK